MKNRILYNNMGLIYLNNDRIPLSKATADACNPIPTASALEFVHHIHKDAPPAGAHRMADGDGAAAILGIYPSTLRARLHKLKIVRPDTKDSK